MVDRYLLRYFLAVVDQGNFSRAARHCRVSQPTLSGGIAKLEASLGRALFTRTSRRVELTAAGARFAPHARRIETGFAEAERAAREDAPAVTIRIGIANTLPTAWIGAAVSAAREGASERLELVDARPRDLRALLDRGRVDAVLGVADDGWPAAEILFDEAYALALADTHRLAGRAEIAAEEVAGETMIVRRQCEALGAVSRYFTSRGIRPFMAARTTNDDQATAYVRAGLGITVMPRCLAVPGVAIVPLAGFALRRSIALLAAPAGTIARDALLARMAAELRRRHTAAG